MTTLVDFPVAFDAAGITTAANAIRSPAQVIRQRRSGHVGVRCGDGDPPVAADHERIGTLPPLYPEWLGDRSFCTAHGTRFAYVAGEMANGIATARLVTAMAQADLLGFFGAAGLRPDRVAAAIDELAGQLRDRDNWGVNLIHSPNEPAVEQRVAELLIDRRVPKISASAFLDLTPAVVRCAAAGLRTDASGRVVRRAALFAKVSRPEVAEKFMLPAPEAILADLVRGRQITETEARLAALVPVAEDVTVEGDSGGHTDNRPLVSLLPTIMSLRDAIVRRQRYDRPIRIGAAGGLGTPASVAAAFALGAAYVVTGSVNQICLESGLSDDAKRQLAQADIADVVMAPSADMFELGVKVQVLRRGTMFATRATQLYETYRAHPSLEAIPDAVARRLERDVFGAPLADIWAATREFWLRRDPAQVRAAEQDDKHRMALVFRWYLGSSSRWAIDGEPDRRADYQIWCGPAMGAFNRWVDGGFLSRQENRSAVQIARNLLEGAAVATRAHQLRTYGVPVPASAFCYSPRSLT